MKRTSLHLILVAAMAAWILMTAGCSSDDDEICGDGSVQVQEECDDGNEADGDGCSSTCAFDISGDYFVTASAGGKNTCGFGPETFNLTLEQSGSEAFLSTDSPNLPCADSDGDVVNRRCSTMSETTPL